MGASRVPGPVCVESPQFSIGRNSDALGIEFVGATKPKPGGEADEFEYDPVTREQQAAFDWLLPRLLHHFHVRATEVFRHLEVSWKQPSEASSVRW